MLVEVATQQNLFDIKHNTIKRGDVMKRKQVIDRVKTEQMLFKMTDPKEQGY